MAADDLVTKGSTASAVMWLINFPGPCMFFGISGPQVIIPLTQQNCSHFTDNIFKWMIFLNKDIWI